MSGYLEQLAAQVVANTADIAAMKAAMSTPAPATTLPSLGASAPGTFTPAAELAPFAVSRRNCRGPYPTPFGKYSDERCFWRRNARYGDQRLAGNATASIRRNVPTVSGCYRSLFRGRYCEASTFSSLDYLRGKLIRA
jgi:hypothetical protein